MSKALVVLSGGQDSTTCLFWAVQQHGRENVNAVTFDYGQRHRVEIQAAMKVAQLAGIERHEIVVVGDILAGRSPLTDPEATLEQYESHEEMEAIIGKRVEKTFVPMRNALFLTLAANRAVCDDIYNIVTGVCQADNANYPDCRESFIELQCDTINEALGYNNPIEGPWITIETPLMYLDKPRAVTLAASIPGAYAALAYSHTAYDGQYPPTGQDHASVLRAYGFEKADLPDPLVLRAWLEGAMDVPKTENYRYNLIGIALANLLKEFSGMPGGVPTWLRRGFRA